jgi:hypothetical protein
MLERGSRHTLGVLLLEAGKFNQTAPGFQGSSLYSKIYSFGQTAGARENRPPSPRSIKFVQNEAEKLFRINKTCRKRGPNEAKRS